MASYAHLWLGRILITLGIINGGLGLKLAGNVHRGTYIAYGVVAGLFWLAWMLAACFGEVRRRNNVPRAETRSKGSRHASNASSPSRDVNRREHKGPTYA